MKIWRVEDKKGIGPYMSSALYIRKNCSLKDMCRKHNEDIIGHPNPGNDDCIAQPIDTHWGGSTSGGMVMVSGFNSYEQLEIWFDGFMSDLKKSFKIKVYEVPIYQVNVYKRQVLFNKNAAELITEFEFN